MRKYIFLLFMPLSLFAQKHDYTWYFGYDNEPNHPKFGGMTLSFQTSPPQLFIEKKKVDFGKYTFVCSDSLGKALFSSNGISIQNAKHSVMQGGDTINPGYEWGKFKDDSYPGNNWITGVPAPGLSDYYYLLHLAEYPDFVLNDFFFSPLYYSLLDMNANGGLGRVVKKNQVIAQGSLISPTLVKHGNGRDWWLMTAQLNDPSVWVYLISPSGISGPYIQQAGPPFPKDEGGANPLFTPDGNTYIRPDGINGPRIYDFDRCTGQLSNLRIVPYTSPFYNYALAVSPNSRYLYGASMTELVQYDLQSVDIGASMDTVAMYDGFGTPGSIDMTGFFQATLGPDAKIYFATTGTTTALHLINRPDLPGTACDAQQHGILLPKFNDGTMYNYPNYRLGKWASAPCDTLPFQPPPGGSGFTDTPYAPARMHSDTTYRLMTPVPDKTQPPEIYFRKKELPEAPEVWRGRFQKIDKQAVLNDEPANDEGTKHD
jgi:hypothetical protein